MNAVLLIAHAPLAQALRAAALHVFPDAGPELLALDVSADESPEHSLARAQALLAGQERSLAGVLILADVLGATPCNVATRLLPETGGVPCQLLAGVNLPMLLRALGYRHEPLERLGELALAGGVRGMAPVAP